MNPSNNPSGNAAFIQRTLTVIALTALFLAVMALLGIGAQVLLLVLASVLLALPLRAGARWLHQKTGLPEWAALIGIGVSLLALLTAVFWLMSGAISQQLDQLQQQLPELIDNARRWLSRSSMGKRLVDGLSSDSLNVEKLAGKGNWFGRAFGAVSSAFSILSNLYIVLFVTLFITASPSTYRQGILLLIPPSGRQRGGEVLDKIGQTLINWLLGKLFSMTVVGVLTALGLWALGIPLIGVLSLLAGLLSFIPNFGPILALIPAVLVALLEGPDQALYVAGLYVLVQAVESNLITPLVQQRLIEMPPALILVAQVLMGTLVGGLGVMLATPVVAILMVLVKMLYIRDGLGDQSVKV